MKKILGSVTAFSAPSLNSIIAYFPHKNLNSTRPLPIQYFDDLAKISEFSHKTNFSVYTVKERFERVPPA